MSALPRIIRKDLLRTVRSPLGVIIFLLFPLVFSLLIGAAFGGHAGAKLAPIKLALVDEDGGILSRFVTSAFTQEGAPVKFDLKQAELPEAIDLVENDKVSAVLRIPAGFSDSLISGSPTRLELVKNPAQSIYPQIVEEYVSVLALFGTSASRLLGEPMREIRGQTKSTSAAPEDPFVSRVAVDIRHRMRGVGRYAFPPAIRIEKEEKKGESDSSGAAPLTVALFVLPGMAAFSLLTLAITGMSDLRHEETAGTLARQFASPVRPWEPIVGKVVSTLVLALGCIVILSLVAAFWGGKGVSAIGFVALSITFAWAATGFATLLQSVFKSERAGTAFGSIIVMVMSMLGGSFIPLQSLPSFARVISPFTLNYWANEGFRKLLFDGASIPALLPNLGILVGLGAVFTLMALPLIRRRFLRGA
jgi:ABC-type multidrug transport system permease subunit